MNKKFIVPVLVVIAVVVFAIVYTMSSKKDFAKSSNGEKVVIRIGAPKAPPVMPILKMMVDRSLGDNVSIELDFWKTTHHRDLINNLHFSSLIAIPCLIDFSNNCIFITCLLLAI